LSNGRIPDQVIEAVLQQHDIADVVGKYVHLTKQGRYLKGLCPFHSEKTPSFTVTPEKKIYHCYGCHAGGNAIHFIMEIEGYSFAEAVRQMAEDAGIPVGWEAPDERKTQEQQDRDVLYKAYEQSTKLYHHVLLNTEQGKPALDYLLQRGLSHKWIEHFQIGYAPAMWDTLAKFLQRREFPLPLMEKGGLIAAKSDGSGYLDKFRDRVIFPISDFKGRVIAFAGRAMGDVQPKYLNSPESVLFNKSRSLYNFHHARPAIRKSGQVVLFEGYMDVIKAWEAGTVNGVASMGTALTEEHASLLRRGAQHAVVCYDGDNAGQAAAYKSIPLLEKTGFHITIAVLPGGLDPDEYITKYGADRFRREIIEGAVPAVKFRLMHIRKNFNLQHADDKLRYIGTAVKIIAELEAPVDREHYLKELSAEFDSEIGTLKEQLNLARQDFLKKRQPGDNNDNSWNNVRNNGNTRKKTLLPAHQTAEVNLLALMMHDKEVADYVHTKLGDQFDTEIHAALAAYLYAYYAQGNPPDVSRYLAALQDEKLESAASSILMLDSDQGANAKVIDDYISQIYKHKLQEQMRRKKEEVSQAERAGDIEQAAKFGLEIITLEKCLKSL
jgi:DNA primase